jgi:hypothetical protein
MMEKDLAAYPVVVEIPVAWGEMDAFGHLNHTTYFRYMETARIHYFEKLDLPDLTPWDPSSEPSPAGFVRHSPTQTGCP